MSLLSLPGEVLKLVLTQVPLKDRLGSCCLVHTRLHSAAVAASQQLELGTLLAPQRAQSVLNWLSIHGQHVTSLEMSYLQQPLTKLPCPNLLEFRLHGGSIQLGPTADGCPGVLEGVTKLTHLELCTTLRDGPVIDSLSKLVHLRHLDVTVLHSAISFSKAMLPRLQQLTHLRACLPLGNVLQLGALTSLQELCLYYDSIGTGSSVSSAVTPPSLTKLELSTWDRVGFAPSAVLPLVQTGLRALSVEWCGVEGPAPLLACIARLQCLTQLELCSSGYRGWPPPGPAYSALTASSSLASLELAADFPAGSWPFVFGAGHQLPHLTSLLFIGEWEDPDVPWAFGAADLAALTRCCPSLCQIHRLCLEPGRHVSELSKLTALTNLSVYCNADDTVATVQGLAALTQLRDMFADLGIVDAPQTVASLLPLTSLTRLTSICCHWWHDGNMIGVECRAKAGCAPDVWVQVLEQCAKADPSCQPTALRALAQQLAEQRALTASNSSSSWHSSRSQQSRQPGLLPWNASSSSCCSCCSSSSIHRRATPWAHVQASAVQAGGPTAQHLSDSGVGAGTGWAQQQQQRRQQQRWQQRRRQHLLPYTPALAASWLSSRAPPPSQQQQRQQQQGA